MTMENTQSQKIIKFQDVKQDILNALESKKIHLSEPVDLFDGFISQPFSTELSDSFTMGDSTIPMIILVGRESGQIYFIALMTLLNIES